MRRGHAVGVLAVAAGLALVAVPELGAGAVLPPVGTALHPHGLLGALVRAAHGAWDIGVLRSAAAFAALGAALAIVVVLVCAERWRGPLVLAVTGLVALALLVPGVALQAGLRDATSPWLYDNDSTYEIELAGHVLRSGADPYGHDYGHSGLERFYPPSATRPPALDHLAYFPGTVAAGAAWTLLPSPLDDLRFLVLVATLGLLGAALMLPGPLALRLGAGLLLAANPLLVRGAWTGTADALCVLPLVLSFAAVHRRRWTAAAVLLAVAVLFKQFAVLAIPFVALAIWQAGGWAALRKPAAVGALVLGVGIAPFVLWSPTAFWADTVTYAASAYRVIGYGVAGFLVRAGVVSRNGAYPFLPIAAVTLGPVLVVLLLAQRRLREPWLPAAGFAVSVLVLVEVARVFQTSYLVYPLAGGIVAATIAVAGPALHVARNDQ